MNTILVRVNQAKHAISRHIYGHFSEHLGRCIYDGFWVGEDSPIPNTRGIRKDIVEALRQIRIPNLRWPGGCFADSYHWKDGIGPRWAWGDRDTGAAVSFAREPYRCTAKNPPGPFSPTCFRSVGYVLRDTAGACPNKRENIQPKGEENRRIRAFLG